MDDFEAVFEDLDSLHLFTGVASLVHEAVDHAFDDRALDFFKSLLLPSAGGVGNGHLGFLGFDSDVIFEADIVYLFRITLTVN